MKNTMHKSLSEFIEGYGNKLLKDQLRDLKAFDSVFSSSTLESHEGNKEYSKFKFKLMSCSGIGMEYVLTWNINDTGFGKSEIKLGFVL